MGEGWGLQGGGEVQRQQAPKLCVQKGGFSGALVRDVEGCAYVLCMHVYVCMCV